MLDLFRFTPFVDMLTRMLKCLKKKHSNWTEILINPEATIEIVMPKMAKSKLNVPGAINVV